MSTFVIHLLIPPLMALSVRFLPYRYVWAWVWVAVVSDIDYIGWITYKAGLTHNFHRALLHNVFILGILVAGAIIYQHRFQKQSGLTTAPAWISYMQTSRGAAWVLSSYYYFTHLLLDLFQGGIAPFYPFTHWSIHSRFAILVDTATQQPVVEAETASQAHIPIVSEIYVWLNSEEFSYLLLLTLVLVVSTWHRVRFARSESMAPSKTPAEAESPSP